MPLDALSIALPRECSTRNNANLTTLANTRVWLSSKPSSLKRIMAVHSMPERALRACAGGCGALVASGRCPNCRRTVNQARPNSSQRGYGWTWVNWPYLEMLIEAGIEPVCGAVLPGGPVTSNSQCKAAARNTLTSQDGSKLHRNHVPPLEDWEREHPSRVMDPNRIELLCRECHSAVKDGTFQRTAN